MIRHFDGRYDTDVARAEHVQLRGRPLGAAASTAGGVPLPAVAPSKWHTNAACDIGGVGQALIAGIKKYIKIKRQFLYSTVSSPQDRSKRFTLCFPDRPVHSDTISALLGSIQPYATINARRLLVHISTTVYSQVLI